MAIDFDVSDNIATVTINRPERRNALDAEHYSLLSEAWQRVRDDDDIRVAIVTGAGEKAFCAGADIKSFVGRDQDLSSLWLTQKDQLLNRGLEVWKPVIAAVNGFCVGGGMASAQAELAIPDRVPYGISKAGINQLTRIFAIALAASGVRANAVGPGTILTPLTAGLAENTEAYRRILSRTPMGRLGRAEEVASIVSFLASDDASYLTGQTIYPDGGRAYLNYTVPVPDSLPELDLQ